MMPAALGEFEVLILMAVLHMGDAGYPPAVRAEIEQRTKRTVSRGAVYITLDRLAAKGLLGSRLTEPPDDSGRRARRAYKITARGLRALRRSLAMLERMRVGLEPILEEP